MPGAVKDADEFLEEHPDTRARFDKVASLVEGFETPFGLELLSTVHWVITHESPHSINEAVSKVYGWNDRKKQFSPRQVALAAEVLQKKGWIDAGALQAG